MWATNIRCNPRAVLAHNARFNPRQPLSSTPNPPTLQIGGREWTTGVDERLGPQCRVARLTHSWLVCPVSLSRLDTHGNEDRNMARQGEAQWQRRLTVLQQHVGQSTGDVAAVHGAVEMQQCGGMAAQAAQAVESHAAAAAAGAIKVDVRGLQALLEHDNHEMRATLKEVGASAFSPSLTLSHGALSAEQWGRGGAAAQVMREPLFMPAYNVPLQTERELAQARLQRLCDTGLWSVRDFVGDNPYRIFAAHEVAGMCDGSMATKMTVQVCITHPHPTRRPSLPDPPVPKGRSESSLRRHPVERRAAVCACVRVCVCVCVANSSTCSVAR